MRSQLRAYSALLLTLLTFWWDGGGRRVRANVDIESCHFVEYRKLNHHPATSMSESGMEYSTTVDNTKVINNVQLKVRHETDDEDYVLCQVRTLQPELDFENLTVSLNFAMEKVTVLKVVCNDLLFFESVLSPGQLSDFTEVYDLSIEQCKVKLINGEAFLGLDHLKRLKINTGNFDWAARSLELSVGAFDNVPLLTSLDLGYNHMWSLPDKILCQLESLVNLNLTHNLLSDIDDLGIPAPAATIPQLRKSNAILRSTQTVSDTRSSSSLSCLAELKSLDLSYNTMRRLGSRRFEKMKRLEDLRLEHNWLEELDDEALFGLTALKHLNLSSNRLVALPAALFQNSKSLRSIDLRNNSLSTLAPGLLSGLEWLVVLDLGRNTLSSQWITVEAFRGLVRLVILNLSHNQLTHLTPATFSDLYTLQVIDLSNNLISSIADSTFMPMSNLHSLNLARNKLVSISSKMFNGLYVLHRLALDFNQLTTIEEGAMRNCTSLSDLGLVGNLLDTVPEALRGLQYLKTLDLGENRIEKLTNESFLGMSQLYGIRLVANQLVEIPKGVCDPISDLRVFNVAHNKISRVASGAFVSCPELRVLRLDSNSLETFPVNLAPQLPKLLWLNVSQNRIGRADYSLLPTSLEWFDISHNQLLSLTGAWSSDGGAGTLGKNGGLSSGHSHHLNHHNAKLRVVEASHNLLTQLDLSSVPPSLDRLTVSYNRLNKIVPDTFSRSSHLRRVDVIGNQLETIPLSALRFQQIPLSKPLPEFFLGGNPFLCDCDMEYLLRITQLSATRQYPVVLDLDAIICRLTYSRAVTHVPLPEIKPHQFLCPYTFHCFQTCQCCEFDACDCSMTCPNNCTCYHGDSWTANVVDCANTNLTSIPSRIPMDSTAVYLDGNWMPVVKSHSFIGRKTLRSLFLNSSQIETISNKSFNGLQSLEYLHLESNRLRHLHGYEFDQLNKLKELFLQDNLIETISNTTFLSLKELEILRLDGNRLAVFTVWQLSLNPYLVEIGLGRNAWHCDCIYLHQLYGWVTDNSKKVVDLGQIRCIWNNTKALGPYLTDYNSTCGTSWAMIQGGLDTFDLSNFMPLIVGLVTGVTFLLVVMTLLFVCRRNIRIWLHTKFGLRLCPRDEEYESEKSFDAYLLYSQKDEEFVTSRIVDELETGENYRLCLHYRDLLSESGDLKEVMTSALESSKSLVIILSRNFFQVEWTSSEYRAGFHALIKSCSKRPQGVKSILVVFAESVPESELGTDLGSWLKSSCQTVTLKLADKKFWSKFKYALPDPSAQCHYHSNITSQTTTSSAASTESAGGQKFWSYAGNTNFVALPPKYGHDGDSEEGDIPSFLFQPNAKSPVPLANFGKKNSSSSTGGESYLSLEGEHVYSTLDPPSPPTKIQLPNGFTYTPGPTQSHHPHAPHQWHPHPPRTPLPTFSPKSVLTKTSSGSKRKSSKEGSTGPTNGSGMVQTYLV